MTHLSWLLLFLLFIAAVIGLVRYFAAGPKALDEAARMRELGSVRQGTPTVDEVRLWRLLHRLRADEEERRKRLGLANPPRPLNRRPGTGS